jgi:hypothetical protein
MRHDTTTARLTVTNCRFLGNRAGEGGAVRIGHSGAHVFTNCLFSGNYAAQWGGGLYSDASSGACTVTNCTFSHNDAELSGGAILNYADGLWLTNCILWGNRVHGQGGESAQIVAGDAGISYCCIEGWTGELGGVGNIGDDPLWIASRGPDQVFGTEDDNFRLRPGSPCVDAGSNDADTDLGTPGVQPLPVFDLDGSPRFADDPTTPDTGQGTPPIVDLGPYEVPQQAFLIDPGMATVAEGDVATFTVALTADPVEPVTVSVAWAWGDADIVVQSGAVLTFDSGDFWIPQAVALYAADDMDFTNGQAAVRVEAPGITPADCLAVEADDEPVPAVVFVDAGAGGANIGTNWTDAFTDLQHALWACKNRPGVSEIWVAAGTYRPEVPGGDRCASFQLVEGVAIYGGFAGSETAREQRDPAANLTILNGDLNGNDGPNWQNNEENSYHVVTAFGIQPDALAVLNGFVITAGNADGVLEPDASGGGMYTFRSSPEVSRCVFWENAAQYGGGLLSRIGLALKLADCDFIGNRTRFVGGGAMIYEVAFDTIVVNCRFIKNWTRGSGGGMVIHSDAAPTLVSCLFLGNEALTGYGGALYNAANGTRPVMVNCSIVANNAYLAGGIADHSQYLNMDLANCVLWGNLDESGTGQDAQIDVDFFGSLIINYCCVQGWTGSLGGVGNIGDDPLFVDADGSDDISGTEDDDLRLLPGSPCIDAADNDAVPPDTADLDGDGDTTEGTPLDLGGNSRFVDDPDTLDTGSGTPPLVDMGAYEFGTDCNHNGVIDALDIAGGTSQDCDENEVPDECEADADGDGVIDDCDACPDTHVGDMIVIDGCDTGVADMMPADDGCSMAQRIAECAQGAENHGAFVSCVAHLTNAWKQDGLISGQEKGHIQCCAAQADIP